MKSALLLFPVLALAAVARAESPDSIPDPRKTNRSSIYDGANVLNNADKQRIDARVGELKRTTDAQLTIVLVQTLEGMPIQEFANTLGRRIGVGTKGKDNGLLFLFAIKDRKSWIEVGPGLQDRLTDARSAAITREQILPAFKEGRYGSGILSAVQVASNYIEGGTRPVAPPVNTTNSVPSTSSSNGQRSGSSSNSFPTNSYNPPSSSGSFPGGLVLLGVLAMGGIGGLVYLGSRPRKCPRCQTAMQQSPAPASELSPANQCEQFIGSRSFTRFGCPKCGFAQIEGHTNSFSGFTRCEACNNQTARQTSELLQQPNYNVGGIEETTNECVFPPCRHISRRQRTLPRLQRSSTGAVIIGSGIGSVLGSGLGSSSGSGDWGGSSGGGGGYDGGLSDSSGGGDFDGGGGGSDW